MEDRRHIRNHQEHAMRRDTPRAARTGPSLQVLPPPPPADNTHLLRKRHHPTPHPAHPHAKQPKKESDIVDRIWHDIDEEQREKQAKKMAEEEAKRTEPPVMNAGKCIELTVNNLKNFKNEDDTVNGFVNRQEMVDRLLGYKMLLGKMENCVTLGYEKMSDQEIQQLSDSWMMKHHQKPEEKHEEVVPKPRVGPRTPTSPHPEDRPRRGPKTPPGSPGPSNPPVMTNRTDMVGQLARMFGQSTYEVEQALGGELDKALETCSKKIQNEMFETFKVALKRFNDKKPRSSALSDQMELVSDTSLSVDMKIVKKEEPDFSYHMAVPPPPIPPPMQPQPQSQYTYYPQMTPQQIYQYPPPQPVYQQSVMCYPPPHQQQYGMPVGYQMPAFQQSVPSNMVLPPVNVPPPPMGVRIDTPIPSQPIVQQMAPVVPTVMPPPPMPTQVLPPPVAPPPKYSGDCWRPPPQPAPPPPAVSQAPPLIAGVQTTLFSALGLHKPPPPPPPPPPPCSSSSISVPLPPPPPPPVAPPPVLSPGPSGYRNGRSSSFSKSRGF